MKVKSKILSSVNEESLEAALSKWFVMNPSRTLKNTIVKFTGGDKMMRYALMWQEVER